MRLVATTSDGTRQTQVLLYRVREDILELCFEREQPDRIPDKFKTAEGSKSIIWRLHRVTRVSQDRDAITTTQKNHFVFAVRAELQRTLIGRANLQAFVLVNGTAIIKDNEFAATSLDLEAMRSDLKQTGLPGGGSAHFRVFFSRRSANKQGVALLVYALKGFAADMGYRLVSTDQTFRNDGRTWEHEITAVRKAAEHHQRTSDEKRLRDDLATVCPVQTALSRYLTDSADCVVDLAYGFSDRGVVGLNNKGIVDAKVRDAIRTLVGELKLETKDRILVRANHRDVGDSNTESFQSFLTQVQEIAKSMGFKDSAVTFR